jgi:hypothetical protein
MTPPPPGLSIFDGVSVNLDALFGYTLLSTLQEEAINQSLSGIRAHSELLIIGVRAFRASSEDARLWRYIAPIKPKRNLRWLAPVI